MPLPITKMVHNCTWKLKHLTAVAQCTPLRRLSLRTTPNVNSTPLVIEKSPKFAFNPSQAFDINLGDAILQYLPDPGSGRQEPNTANKKQRESKRYDVRLFAMRSNSEIKMQEGFSCRTEILSRYRAYSF
ncbi:unnamed protein product [Periconia digitata]|uniref:Uncharacterized protein n=1 Tax=Periconia digitata TaxID=1303443 RepID=A0A9W4XVT7_9PLEO|nr:unnamed protein product [Periconia digitata]